MSKRKRILIGLFLMAWAIGLAAVIAAMSLKHVAALPKPNVNARLLRQLLAFRSRPDLPFMVHIVYSDCSCAQSLLTHLIARRRFPDAEELILFAGAFRAEPALARNADFAAVSISPNELVNQYGLEAAPVLIMFDAHATLRYAGGYYVQPATVSSQDVELHRQVLRGVMPEPLPVFGCAVSSQLRNALEPLRRLYPR